MFGREVCVLPELEPGTLQKVISPEPRAPKMSDEIAAEWTFLVLGAAALGMACLLALLPAAGHDQMWLLYAAGRMLRGAPLYGSRIFETNPPLILWLSVIPEWLSHITHLTDTSLGKLFVAALEVGIAVLSRHIVRLAYPRITRAAEYGLAFVYISVFAVMPARDFGQRDHLLILLLLPYIFAAGVRARGFALPVRLGWLVGALGLAGVVLKPHQVLIPITVELALLVRRTAARQAEFRMPFLRPEIYAMFISGVAFLGAIAVFAPLYFTQVLPIVRDTYWAYHQLTPGQLLTAAVQLHILGALDLVLLFRIGWRRVSGFVWVLLIAGLSSTLAYYIQGTGWYYQQIPALSILALSFAFLLVELSEQRTPKTRPKCPNWLPIAAAGLAVLALVLTAHFMDYPFTPERSFPVDTPDPAFFSGLGPGSAVMTLSPTIDYTIQPIYKYHLTLGQRYPALLMMPAILRSEDPQGGPVTLHLSAERVAELDSMQRRFILEDLRRWHPALLLVQRCQDPAVHCQSLEDRHDNMLAWFLRDPAFREQFAHYQFMRTAGEFDGYVLRSRPDQHVVSPYNR